MASLTLNEAISIFFNLFKCWELSTLKLPSAPSFKSDYNPVKFNQFSEASDTFVKLLQLFRFRNFLQIDCELISKFQKRQIIVKINFRKDSASVTPKASSEYLSSYCVMSLEFFFFANWLSNFAFAMFMKKDINWGKVIMSNSWKSQNSFSCLRLLRGRHVDVLMEPSLAPFAKYEVSDETWTWKLKYQHHYCVPQIISHFPHN